MNLFISVFLRAVSVPGPVFWDRPLDRMARYPKFPKIRVS